MATIGSVGSTGTNSTTTATNTTNQTSGVNTVTGVTSASSANSPARITGMFSGLDTDSLVKSMLAIEQAKLDKIYQAETKLQWKSTEYNDIITQLKNFRSKYMSATSDTNMYSASAYKAFSTNMAENNYLSITTTSNAYASSHEITSVKTAQAASVTGAKHRSLSSAFYGTAGTNMVAQVTGSKVLQADPGNAALIDLKYADGTNVFTFADPEAKLSFSINGQTFIFNQNETLNDVMTQVNNNSAADVTMSLTGDGKISIKSDKIGASSALNLQNIAGSNVFGDSGAFGIASGTVAKTNLITTAMTLDEIAAATGKDFGFDASGDVSFSINGQSFTFNKTQTLSGVISTVNASGASVKMIYDTASDQFSFRSTVVGSGSSLALANTGDGKFFTTGSPIALTAGSTTALDPINIVNDTIKEAADKMGITLTLDASNQYSFTINGKTFSFDAATTSVSSMMMQINSDADAKVTMAYSSITDSFTIQSDTTGTVSSVSVSNGAGVNAFGNGGFFGINAGTVTGTDAEMVIDGEKIVRSTNSFTIDGMTFNLKESFDSTLPGSTQPSITYNVAQDIDGVIQKVKNFITDYNSLVELLNGKITETVDYDYPILSESQRSSLSASDLSTWDTQAKKGLLHNDSGITSLLTQMRMELYEKVGDTGLSAADIGLTTGNWQNRGQITLDEGKLRSALQQNPDAVTEVMVGSTTSKDPADIEKYSGLITSFFSQMTNYQNDVTNKTLKNIQDQISTDKTSYSDQVEKMQKKEQDYYIKFSVMETALSQYSAQMSWLNAQMGLGSS